MPMCEIHQARSRVVSSEPLFPCATMSNPEHNGEGLQSCPAPTSDCISRQGQATYLLMKRISPTRSSRKRAQKAITFIEDAEELALILPTPRCYRIFGLDFIDDNYEHDVTYRCGEVFTKVTAWIGAIISSAVTIMTIYSLTVAFPAKRRLALELREIASLFLGDATDWFQVAVFLMKAFI